MNSRQTTLIHTIATTLIGIAIALVTAQALQSEQGGGYLHIFGLFFAGGVTIGSWINALHVLGYEEDVDSFGMQFPKAADNT
jgi:hypothetical protein